MINQFIFLILLTILPSTRTRTTIKLSSLDSIDYQPNNPLLLGPIHHQFNRSSPHHFLNSQSQSQTEPDSDSDPDADPDPDPDPDSDSDNDQTQHTPKISVIDYESIYHQFNSVLKALMILVSILWLAFLFSFVGIVASDFFCPNLSTISSRLGLSESLAGVTLLGFGNGAPDVFSTYAAFKADTGSLAIGELVGAASFIVSVVVGSMSIIRPFKVPRHAFLRDIGFFTTAIVFVLIIIKDGFIRRWEAYSLVLLYLIYVGSVLLSTWSIKRKRIKLDQIRIARNEYAQDDDDLDQPLEQYLDDPDFPIQPAPESDPPTASSNPNHSSPGTRSSPQLGLPSQPRPSTHRVTSSTSDNSHDSFQTLLESSFPVPVINRRMRAPSLCYRASSGPPINLFNADISSNNNSNNNDNNNSNNSNVNNNSSINNNTSSNQNSNSNNHNKVNNANVSFNSPPITRSISSSDGVSPPNNFRRRRRNTVMMHSIRPSLLGAIEFRDVVNSLRRDSMSYATTRINGLVSPQMSPPLRKNRRTSSDTEGITLRNAVPNSDPPSMYHFRYRQSYDSNRIHRKPDLDLPPIDPTKVVHKRSAQSQSAIVLSTPRPWELDGNNHPPTTFPVGSSNDEVPPEEHASPPTQQPLSSEAMSQTSSYFAINSRPGQTDKIQSSTFLSPSESDNLTNLTGRVPSILITTDREETIQLPHSPHEWLEPQEADQGLFTKSIKNYRKQWPRWEGLIKVIWETLLPSLKGWPSKSFLGKFLAVFSAPAILVLTLTLPVVLDDDGLNPVTGDIEDHELDEDRIDFESLNEEDARQEETSMVFRPIPEEDDREELICGAKHKGFEFPMRSTPFVKAGDVQVEGEEAVGESDPVRVSQSMSSDCRDGKNQDHSGAAGEGQDQETGEGQIEENPRYSNEDIACTLATVQASLTPAFWVICFGDDNLDEEVTKKSNAVLQNLRMIEIAGSVLVGLCVGKIVYKHLNNRRNGGNVKMIKIGLCFLGFFNSMVWILKIVNEVIEVLNFFGHIFHLSNSILGLTIFGIGNSLGDFVANVAIARMGFPLMAISACFGGPMLNILLGLGVSSSLVIRSDSRALVETKTEGGGLYGHPPLHDPSMIRIESSKTLVVSTVSLLIVLIFMLVYVPTVKGFCFDRQVGFLLISAYVIVFSVNLVVEVWLSYS